MGGGGRRRSGEWIYMLNADAARGCRLHPDPHAPGGDHTVTALLRRDPAVLPLPQLGQSLGASPKRCSLRRSSRVSFSANRSQYSGTPERVGNFLPE